eukprot:2900220-Alexandrium_andersonii.AAC.1
MRCETAACKRSTEASTTGVKRNLSAKCCKAGGMGPPSRTQRSNVRRRLPCDLLRSLRVRECADGRSSCGRA